MSNCSRATRDVLFASLALLFVSFSLAAARESSAGVPTPDREIAVDGGMLTSNRTGAPRLRGASVAADSFFLFGGPGTNEGTFQAGSAVADLQGWTAHDPTFDPNEWNVSEFNAENLGGHGVGNHALWCGRFAEPGDGWAMPVGYGNNWAESAICELPVSDPSVGQTVGLDFLMNHFTEPAYDFFTVQYDSAGRWITVARFDYQSANLTPDDVYEAPGASYAAENPAPIVYTGNDYGSANDRIRVRFYFTSDGAWSDEDGLFPSTRGGVQVDDIVVSTLDGNYTEDFEGSGPFLFEPEIGWFGGSFANVYPRFTDIDPCRENITPVAGFIDYGQDALVPEGWDGPTSTGGSTDPNWSYGIPGGFTVNATGGIHYGECRADELWSPVIEWDLPGAEDDAAEVMGVRLSMDVWEHFVSSSGAVWSWGVRSRQDGGPWTEWRDDNFVYGYGSLGWYRRSFDLTGLLVAQPAQIQVKLRSEDLCCNFFGCTGESTPAPVFDNVDLLKYRVGGPNLSVRAGWLAGSGFPAIGSLDTSNLGALDVRFDMVRDIDAGDATIVRGDSLLIDVETVIPGTEIADVRMHWALRRNPLFDAHRSAPSGPDDIDVVTSVPGEPLLWTGTVEGELLNTIVGAFTEGRFAFDLPDTDFLYPGDKLHYVFEAIDTGGQSSTLPVDGAGFGQWDAGGSSVYDRRFAVRALPSLVESAPGVFDQPSKLVYDRSGRPGSVLFDLSQLGMLEGADFDLFPVEWPSWRFGYGLGAGGALGATGQQLEGYDTVLVLAGDQDWFVLSDGSNLGTSNDKCNDVGLLTEFVELPGERHRVYFGENIASHVLRGESAEAATYVQNVMGVDVVAQNALEEIDNQRVPVVEGTLPAFGTDFAVDGDCPDFGSFDSIRPASGSFAAHQFLDRSSVAIASPVASVVHERLIDGDRKVDVTFPFASGDVRTPLAKATSGASIRAHLLEDVFTYLGVSTGGGAPSSTPAAIEAALSVTPNPFNPRATIRFTLPARGEASLLIYNVRGERVRTLHRGVLDAGPVDFVWEGGDDRGRSVSSGVYYVRASASGVTLHEKLVLIE